MDNREWGDVAGDEVDVFGDALPKGGYVTVIEKEEVCFNDVEVTIPHYKIVKGQKKDFVAYVVQVAGNARSWQVVKRFSEFDKLHHKMMRDKGNQKIVPMFPSKIRRPLESEKHLVKRRMSSLGKYMTGLWKLHIDKRLVNGEVLEEFLQTQSISLPGGGNGCNGSTNNDEQHTDGGTTERSLGTVRQQSFIQHKVTPRETVCEKGFIEIREHTWTPAITIRSGDFEHLIVLELPGVEEEDISITVMDTGIRLFGERHLDIPAGCITHNERVFGNFVIDFHVPESFAPYDSFGSKLYLGNLYINYTKEGREHSLSTDSSASPDGQRSPST